jgi:hypothetical protein
MKRLHIDVALTCLCWLFAGLVVWISAIGCESVTMVCCALVLAIPAVVCGSILVGWRRHTGRSLFMAIFGSWACLVVIASVAVWQWPLRVSYRCSSERFEALARRVKSGENLHTPQRAGLFTIQKAELSHNGIVCLWIEPNAGGSTGFVQCRRDYVPFNLWSLVKLDDRWQFITED